MRIVDREDQEAREHEVFAEDAACAGETEGRAVSTRPDYLRTEYQRDRDKILHAKSFRRLSHKTQVFLAVEGDHFRTRLTHTLEVAQIARTVARALALNEDLAEAIALGHDLGHTPFGHTGEEALSRCIARYRDDEDFVPAPLGSEQGARGLLFRHNEQSLRVVEVIENDGAGLNLTAEVRDGIVSHRGSLRADTLEGRIVGVADRIAYVNHDIDDAIRAGLLTEAALPASTHRLIGTYHSERIETLVVDLVENSERVGDIMMSAPMWDAMMELRSFLFENVYSAPLVRLEAVKGVRLIEGLFDYYIGHPASVPAEYRAISKGDPLRAVVDYIAGMTDRFARRQFENVYIPRSVRGDAGALDIDEADAAGGRIDDDAYGALLDDDAFAGE